MFKLVCMQASRLNKKKKHSNVIMRYNNDIKKAMFEKIQFIYNDDFLCLI